MSIRLNCPSCRAVFLTSEDNLGHFVDCPKCGAKQRVPSSVVANTLPGEAGTVFVPATEAGGKARRRSWIPALLVMSLLAAIGVVGGVAWPSIMRWWRPVPPDPIEVVASDFLHAVIEGNAESLNRTSILPDPPAIRSVHEIKHLRERDQRLKGSFRPIADLHQRIAAKFEYDPSIGRFKPLNALGAAAETLDVLQEAKEKGEGEAIAKKIESGDPEDLFDAAEQLSKTFTKLAEGALAPKKLLPTYQQLVKDSKPPLPATELDLALNYGKNREMWDALLKRPFPTLKSDGPYLMERADVVAQVTDSLASSGDPRTELHIRLERFRLEGIDTSWKVVAARRGGFPPQVEAPEQPVEEKASASSNSTSGASVEPH